MRQLLMLLLAPLALLGCQSSPDYKEVIAERASQNLELTYSGIKIGDSISRYGNPDNIVVDVKDESKALPDYNNDDTGTVVLAKISVEQRGKSQKVDAIVLTMEDYDYVLESLVKEYVNKYGIYSYCEFIHGWPGMYGYKKDKRVPNDDVLNNPDIIMSEITRTKHAMANYDTPHRSISIAWVWKNGEIIITSYTPHKVDVIMAGKRG